MFQSQTSDHLLFANCRRQDVWCFIEPMIFKSNKRPKVYDFLYRILFSSNSGVCKHKSIYSSEKETFLKTRFLLIFCLYKYHYYYKYMPVCLSCAFNEFMFLVSVSVKRHDL